MIPQEIISQIEACIASNTLTDAKRQEFVTQALAQGATAAEVTLYMNTRQPQVKTKSAGVNPHYEKAKDAFDSTLKDIQQKESKQEKKKNTIVVAVIAAVLLLGVGLSIYFWMDGAGIRAIDEQFSDYVSQVEALPIPSSENYDDVKQQLYALPIWNANTSFSEKEANYEQTKIAEYNDKVSEYASKLNQLYRAKNKIDDEDVLKYMNENSVFAAQEATFDAAISSDLNSALVCLSQWKFKEEYVQYVEGIAPDDIEGINKAYNAEIDNYNRRVNSVVNQAILQNNKDLAQKALNLFKSNAFIFSNIANKTNPEKKDITYILKNTARQTVEKNIQ